MDPIAQMQAWIQVCKNFSLIQFFVIIDLQRHANYNQDHDKKSSHLQLTKLHRVDMPIAMKGQLICAFICFCC